MNPLTKKLQGKIRKHLDNLLPQLSREWFTNTGLECGTISPITMLNEQLLMIGSVGAKLIHEDLLLKSFHPSLPIALEGYMDRRESLIQSFFAELIYTVSDKTESQLSVVSKSFDTSCFQPVVSIELRLSGSVFGHVYFLPDFVDKTWPLKVKPGNQVSELVPVNETVNSKTLELYISAGTLSLSFQELINLKKGQVVISNLPIRSPFAVKHDGKTVFHSYLGRQSNKKAIVVR